ncbi:MAG: PAS domain S-box protein [Chloroflexi bacterium]|nr:MAG: PAS domain S-box protein [Chloroflexota bacterium]
MPFAFAAAVLAAILGVITAAAGQPDYAFPIFIALVVFAAVLAGVAVATSELMRESRSAAALAERRVEQLAGVERRLRATVEWAGVGLGTADLQGRFLQVTDRLAAILGCGREELLQTTLADLTTGEDRASVVEALALLENGDLTRWEGEINGAAGVLLVRLPSAAADEPLLLVQVADNAARRRGEALRDSTAAVRQVIVTTTTVEQAMPQALRAFCEHLGWSAAQHWALERDQAAMRSKHSWNSSDATLEGFLHASRGVVVTEGAGLVGRVWRSGVPAAEEDLTRAADYQPATAARRRGEALRDSTAAVRQVIVTTTTVEQAMPQALRAFCEHLGWSAAQVHAPRRDVARAPPQRGRPSGDLRALADRDRPHRQRGRPPRGQPVPAAHARARPRDDARHRLARAHARLRQGRCEGPQGALPGRARGREPASASGRHRRRQLAVAAVVGHQHPGRERGARTRAGDGRGRDRRARDFRPPGRGPAGDAGR